MRSVWKIRKKITEGDITCYYPSVRRPGVHMLVSNINLLVIFAGFFYMQRGFEY